MVVNTRDYIPFLDIYGEPADFEALHENGFALASMRSETRSRYYIREPLTDTVEGWSNDKIWDELAVRLGPEPAKKITRGPALEKSIAPLRSFVFEPKRHGNLFLTRDAAHVMPPTGAKGLNLTYSDVAYLSLALIQHFRDGSEQGLMEYSDKALARITN